MDRMTRGEREDLQKLIRNRERVLKSAAKNRSAQLLADFENQMSAIYRPEDDPAWRAAAEAAARVCKKAQKEVEARCREMGIPAEFAPSIAVGWYSRGVNQCAKRRAELRKVAQAQVDALERDAFMKIEMASIDAQTAIARAGLSSDAAIAFFDSLPTMESLMPDPSFEALAGTADPPITQQLLTANALRQRRYRERKKAITKV
jgi:hypothetical protein